MVATDFDAEREFEEGFAAQPVYKTERAKVVLGFFRPEQFIPVHTPSSDLVVTVVEGSGIVRDGDENRSVEPGDVVVVPADEDRGIKAGETGLEVTLVTAPPPTDAEHEPVRRGLERGQFEPE